MANKKRSVKIIQIIVFVLLLLLVLGAVGVIYKFTDGGNEDFKTFYLVYEGEDILTAKSSKVLLCEREHRFDVKYTFDSPNAKPRGYTVKIVANQELDFKFTVDGEAAVWRGEGDVTVAFDLTEEPTSFSLFIPWGMTIETVLQRLYEGKEVFVPAEVEREAKYFTLVVSSYNEKVEYRIDFAINNHLITLSESHIVV